MQDELHSQGQPSIQVVELKNKYHAKVGLLKEKETLVLVSKLHTKSWGSSNQINIGEANVL